MSKVMTMKEAVSKNVKSGDLLFLSGAQHGEPAAAAYEVIRQRIDHLSLVCALVNSATLLIGEGLLDKMSRPQELMLLIRSFLSLIDRFYSPKRQLFFGYRSIGEAFHRSDI